MDYLNPLGNNLAYVMAAEKLLDLEIPERAQVIRVLMCELQRIASHMVWLGTHASRYRCDVGLLLLLPHTRKDLESDRVCVGRSHDPELFPHRRSDDGPAGGFERRCKQFQMISLEAMNTFETLVTGNTIWQSRTMVSA
jgi:NADH-quinone oxidoreductase subunit D